MVKYTDRRYYAEFEDRVTTYSGTVEYNPGDIVFFTDDEYYERIGVGATTDVDPTDSDNWLMIASLPELGYYQFVSLEDLINNYVVLYADDDMHGSSARRKIEAFTRRAIQEFSYSTLKVKSLESVINDSFILPMPQDYVDIVSISYVDNYGTERWLVQRLDSGAPSSALQDDAQYIYDDEGKLIFDNLNSKTLARLNNDPTDDEQYDGSETVDRFSEFNQGATQRRDRSQELLFVGNAGSYATYGKRYYQDSQLANLNPSYVVMDNDGVIYLEPSLVGEVVTLRYVSDGISENSEDIRVHKFAEQAIYDTVYYEMIQRSSVVPASEKQRAMRRMKGRTRDAKLKLSPISKREMLQVLRGQGVWIKT